MDAKQLKAIENIKRAVDVNDSDTLSRLSGDGQVLWTASGSWSGSENVTLGDLRAIATIASVQPMAVLPTNIVRRVHAAAKELHAHQMDDEFILGTEVDSALIQMCEYGFGVQQVSTTEIESMHKLAGTMENEIRAAAIDAVLGRLEYMVQPKVIASQEVAQSGPSIDQFEVGKFYWVWIVLDPDAANEWENELMPARFAGYDESGKETWNFLDPEPCEHPQRLAYQVAPSNGAKDGKS